jgi:serine protease DegS
VVLAIGNPYNIGQTVTVGIISAVGRSGSGITNMNTLDLKPGIQEFIQTDAAINSGNSGGALVNTKGEYIGMNTATLSSVETQTNGISFAISAELSLKIMQEIIHHGRVIRGYLGILARDSAYSDIQDGKLGSYQSGIIVTSIDPNGPAQDILMQNDVIVSINDVRVTDLKQAMTMIASSKPDTVLNFSVVRDGKLINCQVTVVEQI